MRAMSVLVLATLLLPAVASARKLTAGRQAQPLTVMERVGYRVTSAPGYVGTGYNVTTGRYDPSLDDRGGGPIIKKQILQPVGYRGVLAVVPTEQRGKYVSTGYHPATGTYKPHQDERRTGTVYR